MHFLLGVAVLIYAIVATICNSRSSKSRAAYERRQERKTLSVNLDLYHPPNPDTTARFLGRETVTAADAEWKLYYLQACESPAETEFLEAMIEAYDLLPDKGVLKGGQISLCLQVEVKPYRTDFLANDWLVVEIDGATYHSSPEAVAKDRVRDQFFFEQGYGVLRIPAKVVFATPEKAVSNVRSAIAIGRPPAPAMAKAVPQARPNQNWSLGKTLSSIGNTISELNTYVSTAQEVEKATSTAREAFNLEKRAIEYSIDSVLADLKIEEYCSQSEKHKRDFDETYLRFVGQLPRESEQRFTIKIPAITAPLPHSDPTIDEAIRRAHHYLMEEREKYFGQVVQKILPDARLSRPVLARLKEIGCSHVWNSLCRVYFAPSPASSGK